MITEVMTWYFYCSYLPLKLWFDAVITCHFPSAHRSIVLWQRAAPDRPNMDMYQGADAMKPTMKAWHREAERDLKRGDFPPHRPTGLKSAFTMSWTNKTMCHMHEEQKPVTSLQRKF